MSQKEVDLLKRTLDRERKARKAAERILEEKSKELYLISQRLEDLLNEKSAQLQAVFENIVDAYVIIDINGNVLKFNEAATNLFEYNIDNEHVNVMKLIHKDDYEHALNSFQQLQVTGFFKNYETRIFTKTGQVKWVHVNGSLIYDKHNNAIAAQGIVRDITDIRNLEKQKEKLLVKLEKSNDELQEYAHIVSHDLKSPLRNIDALISWIKEDNKEFLDDASLENFELIQITLEKMEQLINGVLNYSSVNLDDNQNEDVDVNFLIKEVLSLLLVPSHIQIKSLNPLPIVKGDKIRLKQLFQNLIGNAIKFNDKENGLIEIDVISFKDYYQFSISDNGIGIDEKYHEKIFDIFHSLNKTSTGIGLTIVKKIVDLHKGEIWLTSEPSKGATFYFTIKK